MPLGWIRPGLHQQELWGLLSRWQGNAQMLAAGWARLLGVGQEGSPAPGQADTMRSGGRRVALVSWGRAAGGEAGAWSRRARSSS